MPERPVCGSKQLSVVAETALFTQTFDLLAYTTGGSESSGEARSAALDG